MLMLASLLPLFIGTMLSLSLVAVSCFLASMVASGNVIVVYWTYTMSNFVSSLEVPLIFDLSSVIMLFMVLSVSTSVYVFSHTYMIQERFPSRFFSILGVFILSMVLLIICPSLVWLMVGWDGLGVTSYLLVMYYQSKKASNAAMLTVLTNRLGDVLILLSLALMMTGEYSFMFIEKGGMSPGLLFFLAVASFTKSAQLPFSAWLPAAMAAPTPVSSLVHSSTLVTAGVYLLIRFSEHMNCDLKTYIFFSGCITCFFASLSAVLEKDMKKVVALSTLSQLGLMMVSIGLSCTDIALTHLVCHAFFKALLFMSVGNSIHLASDYQDLRAVYLSESVSITFSLTVLANFSLMGMPFMTGFFSKDWIMETASSLVLGLLGSAFLLSSILLTAMYSSQLIKNVYIASKTAAVCEQSDSVSSYWFCCLLLTPLSCVGGSGCLTYINKSVEVPVISVFTKVVVLVLILTGVVLSGWLTPAQNLFFQGHLTVASLWMMPYLSSLLPLTCHRYLSKSFYDSDVTWISYLSYVASGPSFSVLVSNFSAFIVGTSLSATLLGTLILNLLYEVENFQNLIW